MGLLGDYTAVIFLVTVILVNIPVGSLRQRYERFSRPWARCIYIPILVNILMRRFAGLSYKAIPFAIAAVFIGQAIGSRLFRTQGKG